MVVHVAMRNPIAARRRVATAAGVVTPCGGNQLAVGTESPSHLPPRRAAELAVRPRLPHRPQIQDFDQLGMQLLRYNNGPLAIRALFEGLVRYHVFANHKCDGRFPFRLPIVLRRQSGSHEMTNNESGNKLKHSTVNPMSTVRQL